MADRSKSDYFGTFLDTLQQQDRSTLEQDPNVRKLLGVLDGSSPKKIWELQEEMSIGLTELTKALDFVTEAGLASVEGKFGRQEVRLTPPGAELAAQLRELD